MSLDPLASSDSLVTCRVVFDAARKPSAARLMISPLSETAALDPAQLAQSLQAHWPTANGKLWLAVTSEQWLAQIMRSAMPENVLIEVPPFLAQDAAQTGTGKRFVLSGASRGPLEPEVQAAFELALTACGESAATSLPQAAQGCDSLAEAAAALKAGAKAVVGWPLGDVPDGTSKRKDIPTGVAVVMELMQRVDKEEHANKLEEVIRRDPALAYRLMRYINSPGFGLSVEINSFQHALMVLGYGRLKRWLALLLAGSVDEPDLRPLMFMAVMRGLLMEELAKGQADDAMRGELFICGVFSLLDRMLGQPFAHLLASLPVPDGVRLALGEASGPLRPWLDVAIAAEQGTAFELRSAIKALLLTPQDANRAVMHALTTGWQMRLD